MSDGLTVSVAVMVCGPAVMNFAVNVAEPLLNVPGDGSCARGSVEVNCTVPP